MSETNDQVRVFFVTDSSIDNEELHETLEQAQNFEVQDEKTKRIRVCLVRNAYRELPLGKSWNYNDLSDTFETIKTLKEHKWLPR